MIICAGRTFIAWLLPSQEAMAICNSSHPLLGELERIWRSYTLSTLRIVLASREKGKSSGAVREARMSSRDGRFGTEAEETVPPKDTIIPLRGFDSRYPSSQSRESACSTVIILTPSSADITRLEGSFAPLGQTPLMISCRS